MGTRRLTRKEMVQEDKIHYSLAHFYQWINEHAKYAAAAAGIVVLVFGGMYAYRYFSQANAEQLQSEFAVALDMHNAPAGSELTTDPANAQSRFRYSSVKERSQKSLEKFRQLADKSPRSEVGQYSRYYVGLNQYQLGQTAEAKKTLQQVIDDASQPVVRNLARNYLAQILLTENNRLGAIKVMDQIVSESAAGFPKYLFLLQVAENYEALGKKDEALKRYKQIVTESPSSQEGAQAKAKIATLQK